MARSARLLRFPFAIAAAIAMIAGGGIARVDAQTAAGSVTALSGSASLHRGGDTLEVTLGMAVRTADEIAVGRDGRVSITFSDGSMIEAGSSSTIVIDRQLLEAADEQGSTTIRLLRGVLRSLIKRSSQGHPPNFEVHTPNAILAARGTAFDTSYRQGERRHGFGDCSQFTDERTYKGVVGVKNAASEGAAEVLVEAGSETTVACDSPPVRPRPMGTGVPPGREGAPPGGGYRGGMAPPPGAPPDDGGGPMPPVRRPPPPPPR
jgi:hypothetical protein